MARSKAAVVEVVRTGQICDRYSQQDFFLFLKNKFMYLILAVLGLRCCAWAFSSCSEWGLLFIAVRGLLTVVASLVAEHGL